MEFLVHITIDVPTELGVAELDRLKHAETRRAAELAAAGTLSRLWRGESPGWTNWGLWSAPDQNRLDDALRSLPLHPYMTIVVHALAPHPSDPPARNAEVESLPEARPSPTDIRKEASP